MKLINYNKIIEELLHIFYEEVTFELLNIFREKNYAIPIPFKVLINLDMVGTFVIIRYKLTSDYIHLLEKEQFDEK